MMNVNEPVWCCISKLRRIRILLKLEKSVGHQFLESNEQETSRIQLNASYRRMSAICAGLSKVAKISVDSRKSEEAVVQIHKNTYKF